MKTLTLILGMLATFVCGCINENTGTSTVVGNHFILPEITDSSDNVAVRVCESVKGAKIWTAKDCNVTISYDNASTNSVFGLYTSKETMRLKVKIEPVEVCPTNTVSVK